MIDFKFETKCYSCSVCKAICPENAISYNANLLPVIDSDKCSQCSACEKVCIALDHLSLEKADLEKWQGYVARNRDKNIRKNSSSGGMFHQIAQSIIVNGGYVCGCIYNKDFMPKHIVTNKIEDIEKMMGSKYVKSDLGYCVNNIKRLIKEGKKVLFSGVPCQIAAIKKIVSSEKLITAAVVCHGSIERDIWKKYIEEESEKGVVTDVSMRDKSHGWLNYGMKIKFADGTEEISYRKEDGFFLKCFTDGLLERDRCLNCKYKGSNIISDLLLGDAWGMDKIYPELIDEYGASVMIVCTSKGNDLFNNLKECIEYKEICVDKITDNNQRIMTPAPENPLRKKFMKESRRRECNIHNLCKKYAENTVLNRIQRKLYKLF